MRESLAMSFDELSMERSKSFMNALQELKNLRPQLYSAAEYCEKSYLHSQQKQRVLDNLKDYAVRVLVNAVDHLGTVAYKLNDLFQQEASNVSAVELKISCLDQQLRTCQTYMDKEGLRQQQLLATMPRHHKHYILPNSFNAKGQKNLKKQTGLRKNHSQAKPRSKPSGSRAPRTLAWHLASETESNGIPLASAGMEGHKSSGAKSEVYNMLEISVSSTPASASHQSTSGSPTYGTVLKSFSTKRKDLPQPTKSLPAFGQFEALDKHEISLQPPHSKSLLSLFFVKDKSAKQKS